MTARGTAMNPSVTRIVKTVANRRPSELIAILGQSQRLEQAPDAVPEVERQHDHGHDVDQADDAAQAGDQVMVDGSLPRNSG